MDLTERLGILKDSGTLSQKNHDNVKRVMEYFEKTRGTPLTEENAAPFITHLCMALERMDKGEKVESLDRNVYLTATQEPVFSDAEKCCKEICEILPQLSGPESEYIVTHLCVLLEPDDG